jgi:hypothetical protein
MSKMTINPKVRNRYLKIGRLKVCHQKLQPHPTLAEQHRLVLDKLFDGQRRFRQGRRHGRLGRRWPAGERDF